MTVSEYLHHMGVLNTAATQQILQIWVRWGIL